MKKKKWNTYLPSLITIGNLFCGFLAICYTEDKNLTAAAWLIFLGMVFDMFDGKVARLTNGSSDFGMQLDSLTDMISFGVAPAFLLKVFVLESGSFLQAKLVWVICLYYVICAAVRLARFNVQTDHDESSHTYFLGLASPAAAGVMASLVLVYNTIEYYITPDSYSIFLMAATAFLGTLMISQIRYVHMGSLLLKKQFIVAKIIALILLLLSIVYHYVNVCLAIAFVLYVFSGIVNELKLRLSYCNKEEEIAGLA